MGLFTAETYRSFAIGFGLGALAIFGMLATQGQAQFQPKLIPSAEAAPTLPDNTR